MLFLILAVTIELKDQETKIAFLVSLNLHAELTLFISLF